MAIKNERTYKNPTTGAVISSSGQSLSTPQDLANQGFSAIGTEEKLAGGTLYASPTDSTGQRYERYVQTPKVATPTTPAPTATADTNKTNGNTGDATAGATVTDGATTKTTIEEPDKEKIRTEKLADAQALIDALNEEFNRKLQAEELVGQNREGRTRALNVAGGLGGSGFASAAAQKTEDYNKTITDSIAKERDARLSTILTGVKNETNEDYEARRKEYIQQADDQIAADKEFKAQAKTDALTRLDNIAKSNITAEQLKTEEPEVYNNLLRDSGLSDLEFDSIMNAKSVTPIKYEYKELKDGTLLKIGDDGTTKEVGNYAPPSTEKNWKIEPMTDGSLYWVTKDPDGNITDFQKFQTDKKTGTSGSSSVTAKAKKAEDIATMTKELSAVVGAEDPYISPQDYLKAKKLWIQEGYSPEEFDDQFEGFRNPNNPNYTVGGAKAETEYAKAEAAKKAEETKKAQAEQKKLEDVDKVWGTPLSARKNSGQSREKIEKDLKKKYGGVPDDAKNWLDRNFK